jgi:hypothetical protein
MEVMIYFLARWAGAWRRDQPISCGRYFRGVTAVSSQSFASFARRRWSRDKYGRGPIVTGRLHLLSILPLLMFGVVFSA